MGKACFLDEKGGSFSKQVAPATDKAERTHGRATPFDINQRLVPSTPYRTACWESLHLQNNGLGGMCYHLSVQIA